MKKKTLKTILLALLVVVIAIATFIGYNIKTKGWFGVQNGPEVAETTAEPNEVTEEEISENENKLSKTVWYNDDDNSALVFADDQNFVWYNDTNYQDSQNYMTGMYSYADGEQAYEFLKSFYSEDEQLPVDTGDYALLVLVIGSATSNGETTKLDEAVTKYLFGFYSDDVMSYVDLETQNQYDFYSDINNTTASNTSVEVEGKVMLSDTYEDIEFAENVDAWQELKFAVNDTLLYCPWDLETLTDSGWSYDEIDSSSGKATLNNDAEESIDIIFKSRDSNEIKTITLDKQKVGYIWLENELYWGSTLKQVISAYGNPNEVEYGENGETILTYSKDDKTMILTVADENTYSQDGLIKVEMSIK